MINEPVKLDVLAISAHRDDTEIVSGGLLLKCVDLGYAAGILDLTAGEMGTRGDANIRAAEAECAALKMGLKYRNNMNMPDAGLYDTQENAYAVAEVIRQTRPELVVLPYWEQRHPDHATASYIGYRACYLAGLKKLPLDGDAYRPRKIIYSTSFMEVEQRFVVDISDQFRRKCEIVACYKSQFEEKPDLREVYPPARNVYDFMETRARQYGYMIGVTYGECYLQKEIFSVDDPLKLPGRSI